MHFFRADFPHHPHDLAARRPAHKRIVHQNHALAFEQSTNRIQLQLHTKIANRL
jgi:hypothetical protein